MESEQVAAAPSPAGAPPAAAPTPVKAPSAMPRWLVPAIAVALLVGAGLWAASALGLFSSPQGAAAEFRAAAASGSIADLQRTSSASLWNAHGAAVAQFLPQGATDAFQVERRGGDVVARQSGNGWDLALMMVNDRGWRVDSVQVITSEPGQKEYQAEDKVVEVTQMPPGADVRLSDGTPGRKDFVNKTTTVNGEVTGEETVDERVAQAAIPAVRVKGAGKEGTGESITARFVPERDNMEILYTIGSGWVVGGGPKHRAGDEYRLFVVLPSGEVAVDKDSWKWDGKYEPTIFFGAPQFRGLKWTVSREDVRAMGVEAVKDGWLKGTYVIGLTSNGIPVDWKTCVVN